MEAKKLAMKLQRNSFAVKPDYNQRPGSDYEIRFCAVKVLPNGDVEPDGIDDYFDNPHRGYSDLIVKGYMFHDSVQPSFHLSYDGYRALDLRECERCYKHLSALHKKLDKLNNDEGHPATLSEFIVRLARVCKITSFLEYRDAEYGNNGWRDIGISSAREHIDHYVRETVKAMKPETVTE